MAVYLSIRGPQTPQLLLYWLPPSPRRSAGVRAHRKTDHFRGNDTLLILFFFVWHPMRCGGDLMALTGRRAKGGHGTG